MRARFVDAHEGLAASRAAGFVSRGMRICPRSWRVAIRRWRRPKPPRIHGAIEASGGTLGTWQISPAIGWPVDGVDALDLVDPRAPEQVSLVQTGAGIPARANAELLGT